MNIKNGVGCSTTISAIHLNQPATANSSANCWSWVVSINFSSGSLTLNKLAYLRIEVITISLKNYGLGEIFPRICLK